jgi:hypothetical protein
MRRRVSEPATVVLAYLYLQVFRLSSQHVESGTSQDEYEL